MLIIDYISNFQVIHSYKTRGCKDGRVDVQRFISLRVVQNHQRGTHRFSVWPLKFLTSNATGDSSHPNNRPTGWAVCDSRQNNFLRRPIDVSAIAFE